MPLISFKTFSNYQLQDNRMSFISGHRRQCQEDQRHGHQENGTFVYPEGLSGSSVRFSNPLLSLLGSRALEREGNGTGRTRMRRPRNKGDRLGKRSLPVPLQPRSRSVSFGGLDLSFTSYRCWTCRQCCVCGSVLERVWRFRICLTALLTRSPSSSPRRIS